MRIVRSEFRKYTLDFIRPMGTSRGVMHERPLYLLALWDDEDHYGLGEAAPLSGLSRDDRDDFEAQLSDACHHLEGQSEPSTDLLQDWPAIRFAVEAALLNLRNRTPAVYYPGDFTQGRTTVETNGLVTMGAIDDMWQQVVAKAANGFRCLKVKIGALDFEEECAFLERVRREFPLEAFELRLDANGAFSLGDAPAKLAELARFDVHSVEQPILAGQRDVLSEICRQSPIPIALDEELINATSTAQKQDLLARVRPAYLVLKPTLLGGIKACTEWIELARSLGIGYWVTSALESNIGLNMIGQWAATLDIDMPQGLGTGRLFTRNFRSPLALEGQHLIFRRDVALMPFRSLHELEVE